MLPQIASRALLEARAEAILKNHIRPRTRVEHDRIVARYSAFCGAVNLQAFPPTAAAIRLFMASLAEKCAGKTIANYITAIRTHCKERNIPCTSIDDNYAISKSIVALKHLCPPKQKRLKPALSVETMVRILSKLDMNLEDHQCFWAMLTIGFYGLLRLGEITQHIDTRRNLRKSHVTEHNNGFS